MSHRFYISPAKLQVPISEISDFQVNHIKNVLRLRPGDCIQVFNGEGTEYEAQIVSISSGRVCIRLIEKILLNKESPVHITVAQSYLKEKKMDLLIRQLTELGINKWHPFFSERSIPAPDHQKLVLRCQRWKKITLEAVKQCRRLRPMDIGQAMSFQEILELADNSDLKLIFWENGGHFLDPSKLFLEKPGIKKVYSVMGPEGGFSNHEIKKAEKKGFVPVKIGPRILRAETATVVACGLLQYLFGDFVEKPLDKSI